MSEVLSEKAERELAAAATRAEKIKVLTRYMGYTAAMEFLAFREGGQVGVVNHMEGPEREAYEAEVARRRAARKAGATNA